MNNKTIYSSIITICRILVGLVFVFSGFVKGVDPLGTAYKITDYSEAFHIGFPDALALVFSVFLNMSEFVLGIALVLGVFPKFFISMALLYMSLFTPLTLVLAIDNPVTDCGCFGDAIVMTNWQTFYKNVVITAITLLVFLYRGKSTGLIHRQIQCAVIFVSISVFLSLSVYTYRHLPILDFRPYKVGTYIPDGMKIPDGVPLDSFEIVLTYEKNGLFEEFSPDNIPWQDTAWKWVETKSRLIEQGYHPPIHDFSFLDPQGADVTEAILQDTSFVFLAIAHKLDKASKEGLNKLKKLYRYCKQQHLPFYFATASPSAQIKEYSDALSLPYEFCSADDIMLKTVVRANPGLVLIRHGTIVGKWHHNDFPEVEDLPAIYADADSSTENHPEKL
ncbi:MAG: DoxX family protein [Cytophagales bacterium]|nr:DoxX family protein [Cytophagales bacterium]